MKQMTDIIIYTNPRTLLHKQDKLSFEEDDDKSEVGEYVWSFERGLPKDIQSMDRVLFATQGFIRGFFLIEEVSYPNIVFYSETWKNIEPIPITHFQGFKYITNDIAQKIVVKED
jgi:hypothetical protein